MGWLCWLPAWLLGQVPAPTSQGISLQFQRQNNFTYRTDATLSHFLVKEKYRLEYHLRHENLYNSIRSSERFVQLQFHHILWQHYRLSKQWELSNWVEIDQFLSSRNQRYSAYLGATYQPSEGLQVRPLIGYSWDYRSGRLDQGISPALILSWQKSWEEDLQTETRLLARYKDLSPRRQINFALQSTWSKEFEEGTKLSFTAIGGTNEMNDYRTESVERIRSDTAAAILAWSYPLLRGVVWESDNRTVQNRRIFEYARISEGSPEYNDLRFGQIDLLSRQRISAQLGKWEGYFLYEYQYLSRRYQISNSQGASQREYDRLIAREQQKDYFRNQTNLEFLLRYQPIPRQRFELLGTNRYLKYDTPSTENFDDHDELNYGLAFTWQASWHPRFRTTYRLLGSTRRYAFLFRERSQDNYTQRNLRMEFIYLWMPTDRWRIEGEQYLYVTYNVKDFFDRNLTDRSTRNLETRLRWSYRINRRMDADGELFRREVHVSYLNWEQFSETTLDTATQFVARADWHWRLPSKHAKPTQLWQLDLGYKHVAQLRYLNTSMTNLANLLTPINLHQRNHQTGPVTGGSWRHKGGASLSLSLWWQSQIFSNKFFEIDRLSTLNTNFREQELLIPVFAFRPFIIFQANILLTPSK